MSQSKTPEQIRHTELLAAIERVKAPLSAMAMLGLVDEFYSKDERQKLYAEYDALREEDRKAYETLQSAGATVEPGISWEKRVEKFGEDEATQRIAPLTQALERRKETLASVNAFELSHPLIVRLIRSKGEVGKSKWEE